MSDLLSGPSVGPGRWAWDSEAGLQPQTWVPKGSKAEVSVEVVSAGML